MIKMVERGDATHGRQIFRDKSCALEGTGEAWTYTRQQGQPRSWSDGLRLSRKRQDVNIESITKAGREDGAPQPSLPPMVY